MSAFVDDPQTLSFMLQYLGTPDDSGVETTSSRMPGWESEQLAAPAKTSQKQNTTKKTKNRRRRKDEIERLRLQVDELEANLDKLHVERKVEVPNGRGLAHWRHRARRELRARRQAEVKNIWFRARLAHHEQTAERLLDRFAQRTKASCALGDDPNSGAMPEERPGVSIQIQEATLPGVTLIIVETTWLLHHDSSACVETALRAMVNADRIATACFSVDYKNVISDASSSHATFAVHSDDGLRFEGSQITRFSQASTTREFEITLLAQTVPSASATGDVFKGSMLLDEKTTLQMSRPNRVSTVVKIQRQCDFHSAGSSHAERTAMAQAIALYVKDEMKWMHNDVARRIRLFRYQILGNEPTKPVAESVSIVGFEN